MIELEIFLKKEKNKIDNSKNIFWYDTFYKRMNVFKCSSLKYEFAQEKYILKNNEKVSLKEYLESFPESERQNKENAIKNSIKIGTRQIAIPVHEDNYIETFNKKELTDLINKFSYENNLDIYVNLMLVNKFIISIDNKKDKDSIFNNKYDSFKDFLEKNNYKYREI